MAELYTQQPILTVASTERTRLAVTTPVTILSVRVPVTAMYLVTAYVTVLTAPTVLTLEVDWTDPDAGPQNYQWYSSTQVPVGVALQAPVKMLAQGGTSLTLTATAGTANQVIVSASVLRER